MWSLHDTAFGISPFHWDLSISPFEIRFVEAESMSLSGTVSCSGTATVTVVFEVVELRDLSSFL